MKIISMTRPLNTLTPMICLQMCFYLSREVQFLGSPLTIVAIGGSVARERAASESMIRLIQRSWAAERGDSAQKNMPMKTVRIMLKLTVIQNCKNLVTFWKMFLPQRTAQRHAWKLLSVRTIQLESLAAEQPVPIARPTQASFRASTSLIPSPVTETLHCISRKIAYFFLSFLTPSKAFSTLMPQDFNPITRSFLCSGSARARTFKSRRISLKSSILVSQW